MKIKENEVNFKKILIYSSIIFAIGVVFIIAGLSTQSGGLNALGLLLVLAGLLRVINTKLLTPGTEWFQHNFLPRLEKNYEKQLIYSFSRIVVTLDIFRMIFPSFPSLPPTPPITSIIVL